MSQAVARAAQAWVGRDFHPGQGEQCMAFVRQVLHDAEHPLREAVTSQAVDGLETSYYLASSLAGRDLGQLVDKVTDLQPGAIVFFANTYGHWPEGTITHVGVALGNGAFVHRPTMSRPVEQAAINPGSYWAGLFRCGLLPEAKTSSPPAPAPPDLDRLKVYAHSGRVQVIHDGKPQEATRIVIDVHDGKLGVRINGGAINPASLALEVAWRG